MIPIDIISTVTSTLGTVFSVAFASNLLFWGIVTGIIAKILGTYSIVDGATAGAVNYIISTVGINVLTSLVGAMNSWMLMIVVYGASMLVVMHFTKLDAIRSIAVVVGTTYLMPFVFSAVFSII